MGWDLYFPFVDTAQFKMLRKGNDDICHAAISCEEGTLTSDRGPCILLLTENTWNMYLLHCKIHVTTLFTAMQEAHLAQCAIQSDTARRTTSGHMESVITPNQVTKYSHYTRDTINVRYCKEKTLRRRCWRLDNFVPLFVICNWYLDHGVLENFVVLIFILWRYSASGDRNSFTFEKNVKLFPSPLTKNVELIAVQMDVRLSSKDYSEVDDVECDAALVAFTDLKTEPQEISWWPSCSFEIFLLIGSHWKWSKISSHREKFWTLIRGVKNS